MLHIFQLVLLYPWQHLCKCKKKSRTTHFSTFYWLLDSHNFIMSLFNPFNTQISLRCRIFSNNCFNSNRQTTMAIIRIRNQMIATHPTIIFQSKRLSIRHVEKAVQMIIKLRRTTWTNTIRNWSGSMVVALGVLQDISMIAVLWGEFTSFSWKKMKA